MRCVAVLVLTMTFFFGLADWAIAGPFGLSMGMKPSEVGGKLEKIRILPGGYRTKEVPQPHNAFNEYLLFFGPKTGLCKIVAKSPEVKTSVYGREMRRAFDRLEERLKGQYGKNKKYDSLEQGSIWNGNRTEGDVIRNSLNLFRWNCTQFLRLSPILTTMNDSLVFFAFLCIPKT